MSIDLFGPSLTADGVTSRPGETRAFSATDTFFQDCSSPDADDGTQFMAAWFNQFTAAARAIARANGQTGASVDIVTQDNANDALLLTAIQYLIQRGLMNYAVDSGTADALVISLSPAMPELKAGSAPIRVKKSAAANTTTTPTIIVNGIGPATITRFDGSAVEAGELAANSILELIPDGTNWRLVSPPASASVAEAEAGILLQKFISPATLLQRRTPYFILSQSGAGSIASGVNAIQPLTVDSGHYFADAGSNLNSGHANAFTCGPKDAGVWLFIAVFGLSIGVTSQVNVAIAKNGGSPTPYQGVQVQATVNTHMSYAINMADTDYVQLSAFQNSGSSQTTSGGQLIGIRLSA